ncbi:MAG: holo-ACP synthase [Burkholderiales bacterium]
MIYGIGTDIVEISRITRLLAKYGERFVKRVLTHSEREDYAKARQSAAFIAKNFAAKEALSKAVGTGFRYPVILSHISIAHDHRGKPELRFHPVLELYLKERDIVGHHVSLTDEKHLACAVVVLERA